MRRAFILAFVLLSPLLTASMCTTTSGGLPAAPAPSTACLPMVNYDAAYEAKLGAAVAALRPGDPLLDAITDYGAMRAANRACKASVK